MIIAGTYSFNHGRKCVQERFAAELAEIETKTSREKTIWILLRIGLV